MVKISTLYHDVEGKYSPNKGQKKLLWGTQISQSRLVLYPQFFLFERACRDAEHDEALFVLILLFM
jgi:hypothetical protein